MPGEAGDDVKRYFASGAARDVVEDDREPEVGDSREMAVEPFRIGLVVVRGDLERGVGAAHGDCGLGERDGLGRGVRACAGDDRHLARRVFYRLLDYLVVLLVRKRWRLARGADGADSLDAARDLLFDYGAEAAVVHGA